MAQPFSVITLIGGCCYLANIDLFLRFGGSLQPSYCLHTFIMFETIAAVFVFTRHFNIIRLVNEPLAEILT